ncbi:MAG: ABC transporter ATP-binding protein/permease [Bacilli bacterium]|jgi:ATP-binding cassette subfamily B protein|nr:ABC transporter ATP-binding protein/permease [Bacilli bacterium]
MQKHSWINNLCYVIKDVADYSKLAIVALVLDVLSTIATAVLGVLLSYFVVSALTSGAGASSYLSLIAILTAAVFVSTGLQIWSGNYYLWRCTFARCTTSWIRINEKILRTDYLNVEPREKRSALMNGFQSLGSNWIGTEMMMRQWPDLLIGALGIVAYATISTIYVPWILLVMTAMIITSALWARWSYLYVKKKRPESEKNYTMGDMLTKDTTTLDNAKDIRAYDMKPWFDKAYEVLSRKVFNLEFKTQFHNFVFEANNCVFVLIRDVVAYLLLLPMVISGKIDLSTFTFLIGIVAGFSIWVNTFVAAINNCNLQSPLVTDYRNALIIKDEFNHGPGLDVKSLTRPLEISMKHVSFRYPGASKDALHDINLNIKPGEKIAVIGNNGAGKTTLIKLICGLYKPTKGTITINGHSITEFNNEDYMTLISALFQDVHPLAFTIKMNVTCCLDKDVDEARFRSAIEKAGLAKKIESLPKKENTFITQAFNLSGIQLSGGETQKLLLARAIYKNAPLLILDEPTAALDPLSEEAMYKKYLSFAEGNTSVFISHRLASTRFCDRIVFMGEGTIKDIGTHASLLKSDADYREMFDLQAKYYRDGREGEINGQPVIDSVL